MLESVLPKLLLSLSKPVTDKLAKQRLVLDILKEFNIQVLKPDFDSIYVNTIIEYSVDQAFPEFTKLFSDKYVMQALYEEVYNANKGEFKREIIRAFHTGDFHTLKESIGEENVIQEGKLFVNCFQNLSRQTQDPFTLHKYNEDREFRYQLLEDRYRASYSYQLQQYFNRVRQENKPENYVELDGISLEFKEMTGVERFTTISNNSLKNYSGWLINDMTANVIGEPLSKLYNNWLQSNDKLLLVLGEYGTGKTTSLSNFQVQLINNIASSTCEPFRMPIFLPLRYFERSMDTFIIRQFNSYGIEDMNYEKFIKRLETGELLLILDGFDEMTKDIDPDEKMKNFAKIRTLLRYEKAKIILSIRKEYFLSLDEFYNTFNFNSLISYSIVEILPFSDSQIKCFLSKRTNDAEFYWAKIKGIFDLHDLAKRPVLLEFIVAYLPEIIKTQKEHISSVDLYQFCLDSELRRKNSELDLLINPRNRFKILQDICQWMYDKNRLDFDITDPDLNLGQYFTKWDSWEQIKHTNTFLSFTFLINDKGNNFRISHKSFRDFMVSNVFFEEISIPFELKFFGKKQSTMEIDHFLFEKGLTVDNVIAKIDAFNKYPAEGFPYLISNCINLLLKLSNPHYNKNVDFNATEINLESSSISDLNGLAYLPPTVKVINLSNNYISDISEFRFSDFRNLVELYLSNNRLEDIDDLKYCKNLEVLHLDNNEFEKIEMIPELSLRVLNLSNNKIRDLYFLRSVKSLDELDVSYNRIEDILPLVNIKKLNTLYLNNNHISSMAFEIGESFESLKRMSIRNNHISAGELTKFLKRSEKIIFDNYIAGEIIRIKATSASVWKILTNKQFIKLWDPSLANFIGETLREDSISISMAENGEKVSKSVRSMNVGTDLRVNLYTSNWPEAETEYDITYTFDLRYDSKNNNSVLTIKVGDFLPLFPVGEKYYEEAKAYVKNVARKISSLVDPYSTKES